MMQWSKQQSDGGTEVVLWWGDRTYVVRHIVHPGVRAIFLFKFCIEVCCVSVNPESQK